MRALAWCLAVMTLAGCEALPDVSALLPPDPDGGHTKVPGSYLDARISPGHRSHLALTGDKQLSCHDCHAIADAGFSAVAVKPCAECHDKQQKQHHPFPRADPDRLSPLDSRPGPAVTGSAGLPAGDGGVAMSCFSCHAFRSVGEAALIDKWGCVRCHVSDKVGPPHISVHTEKCESCHRPHGTPFTKPADCGLCHDVTVAHGRGEKALVADTCMACHPHHSKASVALGQCTGCHFGNTVPPKAQVKPAALFANGHTGCSTCHAAHAFTAVTVKGCAGCHQNKPVLAADKHVACVTCHRPHEAKAAPVACESCHKKAHVEHPKDTRGQPCTGCHVVHAPESRERLAVPCVTCHQGASFTGHAVHATTLECKSCHTVPHAAKPARGPLCVTCHEKQLTLVKTNKGHQACESCHAGLPHEAPLSPKPCLTCHDKKAPPQAGHTQCSSCHQSHSAKVTTKCTDCHNKPEAPLPGLHQVAKHQKCSSCHAPHTPEPGFGPASCRTCHAQLSKQAHPTAPQQCKSCHLFAKPK